MEMGNLPEQFIDRLNHNCKKDRIDIEQSDIRPTWLRSS